MRDLMTRLLEAQGVLQRCSSRSSRWRMVVESLACSVAPPILAHFLRNLSSGRRGVALVRHGVCSECHIQVPSSVMYALVQPHDLHLCDHCGCYLLLPEDEIPRLTRETKKSPRRPASADQTVAT